MAKSAKVESIKKLFQTNMVAVIATVAAIITMFIIAPDKEYLEYIDLRTLSTLFIMLVIVRGFEEIHFFQILARRIVSHFKTTRLAILALIYITFISSMFITNDMALITFLPLGYYLLRSTNLERYIAFTFNMQNIAANLGGMLTPFGNPQNLYLYSYYNIDIIEFLRIMFLPFSLSMVLITISIFFIRNQKLVLSEHNDHTVQKLDRKKTGLYFLLFAFFLLVMFRYISYLYGLIVIILVFLIIEKRVFQKVDYPLLFTFFAFFIFAGNMSRMDAVHEFLSELLTSSTLLTGVLTSQIISNVPAAILLSKFTTNYSDLLIAVNIGGAGTLIASLASLITFREYMKHYPSKQRYFLKMFSMINLGFLSILILCSLYM